jgi:hypothetical protein
MMQHAADSTPTTSTSSKRAAAALGNNNTRAIRHAALLTQCYEDSTLYYRILQLHEVSSCVYCNVQYYWQYWQPAQAAA